MALPTMPPELANARFLMPCEEDPPAKCSIQPRCRVQFAPDSKTLPNAICAKLAASTVIEFASKVIQEWFPEYLDYTLAYQTQWPLPIGRNSIQDWKRNYAIRTKKPTPPVLWPAPAVRETNALLGLAIERKVVHEVRPDNEEARTSTLWLLGLVNLSQIKGDDGGQLYIFDEPVSLVESRAETTTERTEVRRTEHNLWRWYMKRILGRKISEAHRPVGSGTFASKEEFLAVISAVVNELQKQGTRVTEARVANYLRDNSRITSIEEPDRQLQLWSRGFGLNHWREVLNAIKYLN
jgi:hypothetical protein